MPLNDPELDGEGVDDPEVVPVPPVVTVVPETPELDIDPSSQDESSVKVVPDTEEIEEEEDGEDEDKENERMEDEDEEIEESTGNVLTDRTNTLNTSKEGGEEKIIKLFRFPLGTIKKIVKLDEDVNMASQDAVFMVSKATELFIQSLSTEAFSYTSKNKKKTIQKNDVDTAIETTEALAFLDGAMDE